MKKNIFQTILLGIFLIGITIPLLIPYFHPGYFPTHDGEWAVVRLSDMFRSLRDLQFPVRFSGNLNFAYGYPLFNFAYPAPYYLGIIFHFFHIGFVDTIKLLFSLSIIASSFAMYFLSKELWQSKAAGLISAVFYLYFPYRIVDLFVRGSLGESLAFALFPIILLCASRIFDKKQNYLFFFFGVLSFALLILTHNIMALLFTPVLLLFLLIKIFFAKGKEYGKAILFVLLSFGAASFFWLPALLEKNFIRLFVIPIADRSIYFANLSQLVLPKWGYGLPDHPDGFSYQLGIAYVLVFFLTVAVLIYSLFLKRNDLKMFSLQLAALFVLIVFVSILFMFSFTSFFWQTIPLLREINYPWTLLGIIGLLISLLTGFLWRSTLLIKYCVAFLAVLSVLFVLPHAKPAMYFDKGDGYYLTNEATTTSSNEYMPLWVKQDPIEHWKQKVEIVTGEGKIENVSFTSRKISFNLKSKSKNLIRVNTIYWPGWEVSLDNKKIELLYDNPKGVIEFEAPKGKHQVKAEFGETKLRLFADIISLLSFVVLFIFLIKSKVKSQSSKFQVKIKK